MTDAADDDMPDLSFDALYDAIGAKVYREEFRAVMLGFAAEAWARGHAAALEGASESADRNPYQRIIASLREEEQG